MNRGHRRRSQVTPPTLGPAPRAARAADLGEGGGSARRSAPRRPYSGRGCGRGHPRRGMSFNDSVAVSVAAYAVWQSLVAIPEGRRGKVVLMGFAPTCSACRPRYRSHMTIPFPPVAPSASGSTSGEKADMARRTRRGRCSVVVLGGKIRNSGESLSSPRASEPAEGRTRRDSQGILVFPFRTTPRRGCRGHRSRARPAEALPAVHRPGAPFVAHRSLSDGDGHAIAIRRSRAAASSSMNQDRKGASSSGLSCSTVCFSFSTSDMVTLLCGTHGSGCRSAARSVQRGLC